MDVERDITVLVKTFERPEALKRLIASVRALYERVPIVVVDDSARAAATRFRRRSRRTSTSRTTHSARRAAAISASRHVETPYVLVCDDDMVFERRTDLGRMLHALESTSFDVVSCVWLDFDPWKGICRGPRRFEGTLDVEDGVLVHRLGANSRARPTACRSSTSSTSSSSPRSSGWARTRGTPSSTSPSTTSSS